MHEVLLVTTKAFQNADLYKYVASNDTVRAEFFRKIFQSRLINSLGRDEIYLVKEDGKIIGAATWMLIQLVAVTKNSASRIGEIPFNELPYDIKDRWSGFIKVLLDAQKRSIQPPFWSLSPVVVLPEKQGLGIASKLIRKQQIKIDASGLPCFLATQDIDNVDIYLRYGFRTTSEDKISNSDVISYTMVRTGKQI